MDYILGSILLFFTVSKYFDTQILRHENLEPHLATLSLSPLLVSTWLRGLSFCARKAGDQDLQTSGPPSLTNSVEGECCFSPRSMY